MPCTSLHIQMAARDNHRQRDRLRLFPLDGAICGAGSHSLARCPNLPFRDRSRSLPPASAQRRGRGQTLRIGLRRTGCSRCTRLVRSDREVSGLFGKHIICPQGPGTIGKGRPTPPYRSPWPWLCTSLRAYQPCQRPYVEPDTAVASGGNGVAKCHEFVGLLAQHTVDFEHLAHDAKPAHGFRSSF